MDSHSQQNKRYPELYVVENPESGVKATIG
jgi:hypothetical protein